MGAVIGVLILALLAFGYLWLDESGKRINAEQREGEYRKLYEDILAKVKEKAGISEEAYAKYPRRMNKPLTGAQLRRLNEQENAAFLDDRGEPTNSEILKEQANG